jgi:hypothetical protein
MEAGAAVTVGAGEQAMYRMVGVILLIIMEIMYIFHKPQERGNITVPLGTLTLHISITSHYPNLNRLWALAFD